MGFISVDDHGSTVTVNKNATIIRGLPRGDKKRSKSPLQHEPNGALLNAEVMDLSSSLGRGFDGRNDRISVSSGVVWVRWRSTVTL